MFLTGVAHSLVIRSVSLLFVWPFDLRKKWGYDANGEVHEETIIVTICIYAYYAYVWNDCMWLLDVLLG